MKRTILGLSAIFAVVGAISVSVAAASGSATLVVQHQVKGCHAWSLNGGKLAVSQTVHLNKGASLTVTNTDLMSHQLIKLSGGPVVIKLTNAGNPSVGKLKAPYALGLMPHMTSSLKVSFAKSGTYTFTTKEGEDYMPGVKTVGNDNSLKLKVIVA
jgi:hypothetical protein